ncbi:MAG: CorA family divalent cation transporter [Amaricoccus sp.]
MTESPRVPSRSDRAPGLLWAIAASPSGSAERLTVEDLPRAIEERAWMWIHVDLLDQRTRGWIQGICRLPTEVTTLIAGQDTGLALEPEGDEIHGIAPDYNIDFLRVSDSVGQFGFVASERLLVTGWRHPLAGIDAVRNALLAGARQTSGFSILAAITAGFVRTAIGRLRAAETRLDHVEDQILASSTADERTSLKEVRRLALALHRPVLAMLLLLREAEEEEEEAEAARLAGLPASGLAALEEMATRLGSLDHAVRATADRAKLLQEEIAAELADEFEPQPAGPDGDDRAHAARHPRRRFLRHEHQRHAVRDPGLGHRCRARYRHRPDRRLLPDHGPRRRHPALLRSPARCPTTTLLPTGAPRACASSRRASSTRTPPRPRA